MQSGVGLLVARQKQLKLCGISLKKLAVEPTALSLKTAHVIVHVTCVTSRLNSDLYPTYDVRVFPGSRVSELGE